MQLLIFMYFTVNNFRFGLADNTAFLFRSQFISKKNCQIKTGRMIFNRIWRLIWFTQNKNWKHHKFKTQQVHKDRNFILVQKGFQLHCFDRFIGCVQSRWPHFISFKQLRWQERQGKQTSFFPPWLGWNFSIGCLIGGLYFGRQRKGLLTIVSGK